MNPTQEQRETHWLLMTSDFFIHMPPKNEGRIKEFPRGDGENKPPVKRGTDMIGDKYRASRLRKMAVILMHGYSRNDAYDILEFNGELTFRESTLGRPAFNKLCVEIAKIHKLPVRRPQWETIISMMDEGLTRKQVADKLKVSILRVNSAVSRKKNGGR